MSLFVQPFDYLVRSTQRTPNAVAISTPDIDMTFEELLDTSRRMARFFRESGIKPGEVVAVRGPALVELVAAFAIFHEAAVGTNIPAGYLEAGGGVIDWVVTLSRLAGFPEDRQVVLDAVAMRQLAGYSGTIEPREYTSEQSMCRLPFSSGTTGRPKPVPLSIDALAERCIERREQWMPERPYYCHLGLSTGLTFMTFYASVILGDTYISPGHGLEVLGQLGRHRVACLIASPHQLGVLYASAMSTTQEFLDLHTIMSAGAALPDFLGKNLERRFDAEILVTFASTEAGSVAIRRGTDSSDGFAGTVVDGIDVRIVDDEGQEVTQGEGGFIAVSRARQPDHYLGEPEATAQSFREGYFLSGDTGYLVGRNLYLLGRASELINAAGVKVDPARVEAAAYEFPHILEAVAFGFTDPKGLDTVALVFVSSEPVKLSELMVLLRSRLGESTPTRLARVQQIPRNHMGKVNRDEMSRLFASNLTLP